MPNSGVSFSSISVCFPDLNYGRECVGKTSYLYILLVDRLLKGQNTIFRPPRAQFTKYQTLREFPQSTLRTLAGDDVFALVDADGLRWAPAQQVCHSRARIVLTSSPKDEKSRGWMKQLPGGVLATVYMINPFSLKESLLIGFLHLFLGFCLV